MMVSNPAPPNLGVNTDAPYAGLRAQRAAGFLDSLGGTQDRLESATRKSIVVFTVSLQNIIASLACLGLLGPDTPLADSAPPSAVF